MLMKKYDTEKNWRLRGFIIILLAPAIIHLIIFWAGVQVETLIMAFTDADTEEWNNFDNFAVAFESLFTGEALQYMKNTFVYFLVSCLSLCLCIFASYVIYKKIFASTYVKLFLYLPAAISSILMSILYAELLAQGGNIMEFLARLGIWPSDISFKAEKPLIYIIIFDMWVGMGGGLIIWLGGLARIPEELLESARLDGITPVKEFFNISLPLIWPTFVTMITLQIVGFFGASGSVLLLAPNAGSKAFSLSYWLYSVVLNQNTDQYNYATAMGLIITLLTLPLVYLGRRFLYKFGSAEEY